MKNMKRSNFRQYVDKHITLEDIQITQFIITDQKAINSFRLRLIKHYRKTEMRKTL